MMGGGRKDIKFVGKIAQKILSGEKRLKIVNDRFGSPTYAKDLVSGIKRLLDGSKEGIYHLVNGWGCSRYDMALEIRGILNRGDVEIIPVSSSDFLLDANRAPSEEIINQRLIEEGDNWMRDWKEALKDYLVNDYLPSFYQESL